jgi:hypothetical protein
MYPLNPKSEMMVAPIWARRKARYVMTPALWMSDHPWWRTTNTRACPEMETWGKCERSVRDADGESVSETGI